MDNGNNDLREFGKFRLDTTKRVLWFEEIPVDLQPKEFDVLSVLTENAGEVVTKRELMDRVWPESFVEESNLPRHVYRLRKIFDRCGESEELI
ncbi:MAG: winged helix-turn-helix domain-containing protein [bacterium]|nr:winged helix-turn-helix domain-containing protein [bacterium]